LTWKYASEALATKSSEYDESHERKISKRTEKDTRIHHLKRIRVDIVKFERRISGGGCQGRTLIITDIKFTIDI
jgi:hypothetical protein